MTRTASGYYPSQPYSYENGPQAYARAAPHTEAYYDGRSAPRTAWEYSDIVPFRSNYDTWNKGVESTLVNAGAAAALAMAGSSAYGAGSYLMNSRNQ